MMMKMGCHPGSLTFEAFIIHCAHTTLSHLGLSFGRNFSFSIGSSFQKSLRVSSQTLRGRLCNMRGAQLCLSFCISIARAFAYIYMCVGLCSIHFYACLRIVQTFKRIACV